MTQIDDLKTPSINEMSHEEAIEYLRQLRLSRRIPVKKSRGEVKAKKPKKLPKPTKDQAIDLLKLIGEEND